MQERPPAPAPDLARRLEPLRRTLAHAIRDEGLHLWSHRWLGTISRRAIERLLPGAPEGGPVRSHLEAALRELEGLDDRPWTERLAPVAAALLRVGLAQWTHRRAAAPEPEPPPPLPLSQLVVPPEAAPPEPEPEPAPEPESPPAHPARLLYPPGHPDHTGRPLRDVPGLDPALIEALEAAGITTVADLLFRPPADHERVPVLRARKGVPRPVPGGGPEAGRVVAVQGRVLARAVLLSPGRRREVLWMEPGVCLEVLPGVDPDLDAAAPPQRLVVAGRAAWRGERLWLEAPLSWRLEQGDRVRLPVYGVPGVEEGAARVAVRRLLVRFREGLDDPVPPEVLAAARMPGLQQALLDLHLPVARPAVAARRFAFEELYLHQLELLRRKRPRLRGMSHPLAHELLARLELVHGMVLNDAQERVFDEIRRDLRRPHAMTRLLQGDVGAGKALVSLLAAVMVAQHRVQVVFAAPDPLAAEHRFLFAEPLLRTVGLVPILLSEEPTPAQLDALSRGEAQVVFATHAHLVPRAPAFQKLGLVVVEERSRFGVTDRKALEQKWGHPDLLVVTAMPIPTFLTFTLFADHDLSVIDLEGERSVETLVLEDDRREEALGMVAEELERGRQAVIVLPMREGHDLVDRAEGQELADALAREAFPGRRVALYHGQMSREERRRTFEDLQHLRADVLLATTAVEDAPEVPNVSTILLMGADRFDRVRLHRLRGHVAASPTGGRCVLLLSRDPTEAGVRVVRRIAAELDGFAIAEQDRAERGDAALAGERVEELPRFRFADPVRDRELLARARRAAIETVAERSRRRRRRRRGRRAGSG